MSSSSSSSSSSCNCNVLIHLDAECGLELTNGVVYSVGKQSINYTVLEDGCDCLDVVTINGEEPPVCLEDGEEITVATTFKNKCCLCEEEPPTCVIQAFFVRRTRSGLKLSVNKQYLQQKMRQKRWRLRGQK